MVRFGDGFDYKTGEQLGYPQEWLDSIGAEVDPKRESGLWTLGTTQRTLLAYAAPWELPSSDDTQLTDLCHALSVCREETNGGCGRPAACEAVRGKGAACELMYRTSRLRR
jgi:hypothetical protein